MTLWFAIAVMTLAAVFSVLLPLGRRKAESNEGADAAVYADQLAELNKDLAAGLIGEAESQAARVEISRRLIAASDAREKQAVVRTGIRRAVAVLAFLAVPVAAIMTYAALGTPWMPDQPLAARLQAPSPTQSVDALIAQVEAHLEKNPQDARGWTVIAPVYFKLRRFEDAARAYRNALTYGSETASLRADLGEALTSVENGVITAAARREFERAVELDAGEAKAQYFLGLAAEQEGKPGEAAGIWQRMLTSGPPDAPWRPMVQAALQRVMPTGMPKLDQETMDAVRNMPAQDQKAMIEGMVAGLAERLKLNGNDPQGWTRLVRAYLALGQRDKADSAAADGRKALADDADSLKLLNDGLKGIGFDG